MFWSKLFKKKNKIFNTELFNNVYSKMPSSEELTSEEQEYVNNLKEEYLNFYEKEDNYINLDSELFNETACSESVSTSTLESIDNFKIESGETEQGYAYIMFTKKVGDNFRSIIYLKASDEYVFSFEYSGESDLMYEYAVKSLNSIKVNVA